MSRLRELLGGDPGRLLQDSVVTFTLRTSAALVVYLTQVVMARWMGAAELGHYVFALAWLWILSMTATLGLPGSSHRFIPAAQAAGELAVVRGYLRWSRRAVLLSGLAVAALAASITLAVDPTLASGSSRTLLAALPVLPLVALGSLYSEVARAFMWFLFASLSGVFSRPALFLGVLAVAIWLGVEPSAMRAMLMLAGVIVAVVAWQHWRLTRRLAVAVPAPAAEYRGSVWLRVGVPVLIADLFNAYFIDLNLIVSGFFLPPDDIAVYNAALRTVAIIGFGNAAVGLAVAPRAARLHAKGDLAGLEALMRRAIHLTLWPSLCGVLLLATIGRQLLALFGPEFTAGYPALMITGVAQVVLAGAGPLLPLLKVTGHHDRCLVGSIAGLLAVIAANVVLVPTFGLLGGAAAVLLVTVSWTAWLHRLVVRHVGIQPSPLAGRRHATGAPGD